MFNALRPGSGTSTTVLNLAHLFAAGGRSTLLLDLDAHRRAASTFSGQTPAMPGFAELVGGAELGIGLLTVGREGLLVMGPGQMAKEPAEFLAEPRVTAAIGRLRAEFEVILIDTPALQLRTDALSFCAVADAVVLVCRLGRVTEEELDDFFLAHERAGGLIAGTIVTGVPESRVTRTRMILSRRRSRSTLVQAR